MAGMSIMVNHSSGWSVLLTGDNAKYWSNMSNCAFVCPIEELPKEIINYLLENGYIKSENTGGA